MSRTFAGRTDVSKQKWLGVAKTGSINEFRWLFKVKVTFSLASQQTSLRDPCVALLLGFGSNRRAMHSLSHQNFGFAQDDRLTGCLDELTNLQIPYRLVEIVDPDAL